MRCEYLCNWMYFFIPLGMVATNVTMKAFLGVAGYCALSGGGHRHMQWCRGRKNIWRSCDSHYQDTSKTISRIKNYLLFSVYLSFSDKDTMLSNTVVAAPMAFKKKTCRQEMDQVLIMPCFYGGFGFWLPQSMRTIHVRSYMLISHHGSLCIYIYIHSFGMLMVRESLQASTRIFGPSFETSTRRRISFSMSWRAMRSPTSSVEGRLELEATSKTKLGLVNGGHCTKKATFHNHSSTTYSCCMLLLYLDLVEDLSNAPACRSMSLMTNTQVQDSRHIYGVQPYCTVTGPKSLNMFFAVESNIASFPFAVSHRGIQILPNYYLLQCKQNVS